MMYADGIFNRYIQILKEERWPIPYGDYEVTWIVDIPATIWWIDGFLASFLGEDEIIRSILPSYKR